MSIFPWIAGCSLFVGSLIIWMTQGIPSEGHNSDAQKQINAASRVAEWTWFSDMHQYAMQKAWFKDIGVLGLILMQRLLRDRKSFHPIVATCAMAHAGAAIMIYEVSLNYWNLHVALFVFALYLFCFWPYQVVIQGGYQVIALFFCLTSVYFFQMAEHLAMPANMAYFFLGGLMGGLMMFGSASARKFQPLVWAALLYSLRHFLTVSNILPWRSAFVGWGALFIGIAILTSLGRPLIRSLTHRIIAKLYNGPGWDRWRSAWIKKKDQYSLAHYQKRGDQYLSLPLNIVFSVSFYAFLCRWVGGTASFYAAQGVASLGLVSVFVIFMYPRFVANIKGLFSYWTITQWGGHFRSYVDFFARRGVTIDPEMRGAGLAWFAPFFWRMVPFHCALILLSTGAWFALAFHSGHFILDVAKTLAVIFIGLSPAIYGEITGGTQFARTYFPVFAGLLFIFGYTSAQIYSVLSPSHRVIFLGICTLSVVISSIWNAWIYITDIWPARMAPTFLLRTLRKLGIRQFYAYQTPYNNPVFSCLPVDELQTFEIQWIKSLDEVEQGHVVIPGTSSKSPYMESDSYAIDHGDFREDPILNDLLDSREIQCYAIASFRTVGCSPRWGQEGEVPSYRDLILKEVTSEDRWRARAWLLDGTRLHTARQTQRPRILSNT